MTDTIRRLRKPLRPYTRLCYFEAVTKRSGGEITLEEARFLGQLIRGLKTDGPIIEIGTHLGFSTMAMCMHKEDDRPLITVDNFCWNILGLRPDQQFEAVTQILAEATEKYAVQIVRQDKSAFFQSYDGPTPSLIFLDADHGYEATAEDIQWAKSTGAEVICGHDYHPGWPGVVRAVEEAGGHSDLVGRLFVL